MDKRDEDFRKEMEECCYYPGYKCIDPNEHNHGCWQCNVEAGLYKPTQKLEQEEEK